MSYEGVPLDEAFPSFQPRQKRSKQERRKRAEQYYMSVANARFNPDDSDSDDSDSDDTSYVNTVNPTFLTQERNPRRGQTSRKQDLDMKRRRQTGMEPSPNAMYAPRYGQPPLLQDVPPPQAPSQAPPQAPPVTGSSQGGAQGGAQGVSQGVSWGDQSLIQARGVVNYPSDAAQMSYDNLTPSQFHRLSTVNQGYTLQTDQGVRRNLVMPGVASGAKGSSAMGLAFQNVSSTLQDTNPTTYAGSDMPTIRSNTGYMNAGQGFRPEDTASLYDFKNDTIDPYNGYTDYAATYRNPYTGEVTETYTLDLRRYATDIWKEVPTIELGKANPKLEAYIGMGRLARPLPKKTESPNSEIMPTFDPTYGYAEAESGRQDGIQRAAREMIFQQDPGIMPATDGGHWTGYVGLREMARYAGVPTPTLKSGGGNGPDNAAIYQNNQVIAGGMGNNSQFSVGDSGLDVAPYNATTTSPTFYVKTNPNMFADVYQPTQSDVDESVPQAHRMPVMDGDIPMPMRVPESNVSLQMDRVSGASVVDRTTANRANGPSTDIGLHVDKVSGASVVNRTTANRVNGPATMINQQVSQSTEYRWGRDVSLDVLGLPTTSINMGITQVDSRPIHNSVQIGTMATPDIDVSANLPVADSAVKVRGVSPNMSHRVSPNVNLSMYAKAEGAPIVNTSTMHMPHVAETNVNLSIEQVPEQIRVGELVNIKHSADTAISLASQQVGANPTRTGETIVAYRPSTTDISLHMTQVGGGLLVDSSTANIPRNGTDAIPSGLRVDAADIRMPHENATSVVNRHIRESSVTTRPELTVPGRPLIDILNDGSFEKMERQDADGYLQNHWQTDTQRARQGLMAAPRVEAITLTNPVTQQALLMTAMGADYNFPTRGERTMRARSNAKLNHGFATAVPLKGYETASDAE